MVDGMKFKGIEATQRATAARLTATEMSRLRPQRRPFEDRKHRKSRNGGRLARGLLNAESVTFALFIAAAALCCACVFPAPGETVGPDAGAPNAVPVILSAAPPELAFPGPLTLDPTQPISVLLEISDADLEDELQVQFYRDYTLEAPTPPLGRGEIAPADAALDDAERRTRTGSFMTTGWCAGLPPTDTSLHRLSAVVSDRKFLDEGEPLFQAVPPDAQTSTRAWLISCQTP